MIPFVVGQPKECNFENCVKSALGRLLYTKFGFQKLSGYQDMMGVDFTRLWHALGLIENMTQVVLKRLYERNENKNISSQTKQIIDQESFYSLCQNLIICVRV